MMSTLDNSSDAKANQSAAHLNTENLIDSIGVEQLADVLKSAGYRVTSAEQNGVVQLMSASQGVGFVVRFGNGVQPGVVQTADGTPVYLDYTLSCAMQVQGDLPVDLVASWNRTKRFARLAAHGQFLLLEMDVVVAGGVSMRHLLSTIELWDRLVQEFLLHLRNRPAMAAAEEAARKPAATESGERDVAGEAGSARSASSSADGKATLQ
ncbi:YbjN domain-containing protein [Paraburkholderia sediminicola]|nr:YbjN domain-containing protein [Paraburkholderia sediminicola]